MPKILASPKHPLSREFLSDGKFYASQFFRSMVRAANNESAGPGFNLVTVKVG